MKNIRKKVPPSDKFLQSYVYSEASRPNLQAGHRPFSDIMFEWGRDSFVLFFFLICSRMQQTETLPCVYNNTPAITV